MRKCDPNGPCGLVHVHTYTPPKVGRGYTNPPPPPSFLTLFSFASTLYGYCALHKLKLRVLHLLSLSLSTLPHSFMCTPIFYPTLKNRKMGVVVVYLARCIGRVHTYALQHMLK